MLQRLVEKVFQIDAKIRYVAFADIDGLVLVGGMREGVSSYDSDEDQRLRTMQRTLLGMMAREWERNYGEYKFTVRSFLKLTLFQFPLNELVLNISAEPDIQISETARKVEDLLPNATSTRF
jgi:hypothetical protein